MTINEMIQEVNGKTQDNVPKGSFSLLIDMWGINGENIRPVRDITLCKPELQIQRHGKYIQVDIIFISPMDSDLEKLWNVMEYYGQLLNQVEENSTEIPVATLTIAPVEWEGYFHMVGINPVLWTLQPRKPGASASVLRIIYTDVNFLFYEDENLDLSKVRAETIREIEQIEEEITKAEIESAKKDRENMLD